MCGIKVGNQLVLDLHLRPADHGLLRRDADEDVVEAWHEEGQQIPLERAFNHANNLVNFNRPHNGFCEPALGK